MDYTSTTLQITESANMDFTQRLMDAWPPSSSALITMIVLAFAISFAFGRNSSSCSHPMPKTTTVYEAGKKPRQIPKMTTSPRVQSAEQQLRRHIRDLQAKNEGLQQRAHEANKQAENARTTADSVNEQIRLQTKQHARESTAIHTRYAKEIKAINARHQSELELKCSGHLLAVEELERAEKDSASVRLVLDTEKCKVQKLQHEMKNQRYQLKEISRKAEHDVADIAKGHDMLKKDLEQQYQGKEARLNQQMKDKMISCDNIVADLKQDHDLQLRAKEAVMQKIVKELHETRQRNRMLELYDRVTLEQLNKIIASNGFEPSPAEELVAKAEYQKPIRDAISEAMFGPDVMTTRDHASKTISSRLAVFEEAQSRLTKTTKKLESLGPVSAPCTPSVVTTFPANEQSVNLTSRPESVTPIEAPKPETGGADCAATGGAQESTTTSPHAISMSQEETKKVDLPIAPQLSPKATERPAEQHPKREQGMNASMHAPKNPMPAFEAKKPGSKAVSFAAASDRALVSASGGMQRSNTSKASTTPKKTSASARKPFTIARKSPTKARSATTADRKAIASARKATARAGVAATSAAEAHTYATEGPTHATKAHKSATEAFQNAKEAPTSTDKALEPLSHTASRSVEDPCEVDSSLPITALEPNQAAEDEEALQSRIVRTSEAKSSPSAKVESDSDGDEVAVAENKEESNGLEHQVSADDFADEEMDAESTGIAPDVSYQNEFGWTRAGNDVWEMDMLPSPSLADDPVASSQEYCFSPIEEDDRIQHTAANEEDNDMTDTPVTAADDSQMEYNDDGEEMNDQDRSDAFSTLQTSSHSAAVAPSFSWNTLLQSVSGPAVSEQMEEDDDDDEDEEETYNPEDTTAGLTDADSKMENFDDEMDFENVPGCRDTDIPSLAPGFHGDVQTQVQEVPQNWSVTSASALPSEAPSRADGPRTNETEVQDIIITVKDNGRKRPRFSKADTIESTASETHAVLPPKQQFTTDTIKSPFSKESAVGLPKVLPAIDRIKSQATKRPAPSTSERRPGLWSRVPAGGCDQCKGIFKQHIITCPLHPDNKAKAVAIEAASSELQQLDDALEDCSTCNAKEGGKHQPSCKQGREELKQQENKEEVEKKAQKKEEEVQVEMEDDDDDDELELGPETRSPEELEAEFEEMTRQAEEVRLARMKKFGIKE